MADARIGGRAATDSDHFPFRWEITVYGRPVTVNHAWLPRKFGGMYLSAEAESWKVAVGVLANQQRVPLVADRKWRLTFDYFHPTPEAPVDGSGVIKMTEDGLQGIAYKNDRAVTSGTWAEHYEPGGEERLVVGLHLLTGEPHPRKRRAAAKRRRLAGGEPASEEDAE